jgi:hypothetical protein
MGGALVYQVDGPWPGPAPALAAARHIVRTCATDPELSVMWETSRLVAVEQVHGLLADAGGDAAFGVGDPGPLTAALRGAGLHPRLSSLGDLVEIRAIGYDRILDALDHATLSARTSLSIELGYATDPAPRPDEATLDELVMAAGDDAIQAHWSCRWFGATSHVHNGVTVDVNGDVSKVDGHRPGAHRVTVAVYHKLEDAEQVAARIAASSGRTLVFQELR